MFLLIAAVFLGLQSLSFSNYAVSLDSKMTVSQSPRANESSQEFHQQLWPFQKPEEEIDEVDKEFAEVQAFLSGSQEQSEGATSSEQRYQ